MATKLDARILLKLSEDLKQEVEALAEKWDRPASWVIRHAIEQLIDKEKKNAETR